MEVSMEEANGMEIIYWKERGLLEFEVDDY
jgi:hypothetical protein